MATTTIKSSQTYTDKRTNTSKQLNRVHYSQLTEIIEPIHNSQSERLHSNYIKTIHMFATFVYIYKIVNNYDYTMLLNAIFCFFKFLFFFFGPDLALESILKWCDHIELRFFALIFFFDFQIKQINTQMLFVFLLLFFWMCFLNVIISIGSYHKKRIIKYTGDEY